MKAANRKPEFIFPFDTFQLAPGLGHFSCCAANHDFGNGQVPCDKIVVRSVLSCLIEARLAHLHDGERWLELRYLAAMRNRLFEGLGEGTQEDAKAENHPANIATSTHDAKQLQALKDQMMWRNETTERVETTTTGASLLFWAAMADDQASVRELLRLGSRDVNRNLSKGTPALSLCAKMTPLTIAMAFARWGVVELLLEAGSDPKAKDSQGKDVLMYAAITGNYAVIDPWLRRFPAWDLDRGQQVLGKTALHLAIFLGANKRPTIEALLRNGASPLALADNGSSIIHDAAMNPDLSPETMQWLLEYDNGVARPLLHKRKVPQTLKWRLMYAATRFMSRVGSANKLLKEIATWEGRLPLHDTAWYGHSTTAHILVAAGSPLEAKTAQGMTAFQLAQKSHGGKAPAVLRKSISNL